MNNAVLIQQVYPGYGFEPMLELTRAHHQAYCDKYQIDYQCVFDEVFPHDPALGSFAKIRLIQKAMYEQKYQHVIWLDADTLIVKDEDLRSAIELYKIGACWHRIPQLNHWNVGALYIHNSQETREFISAWSEEYPPPKDGWNEQGVFNRLARQTKIVVTISDKWNATLDVSMVPDAVVLGFHGQGKAEQRYRLMKQTFDKLFPTEKADNPTQGVREVTNGT